jgi:hypothetical protein
MKSCCCADWAACSGNTACQNVLGCQNGCSGNQSCMSACEQQHGVPASFVAFNVCIIKNCPAGCGPSTVCSESECKAVCEATGNPKYAFGTAGCNMQCTGNPCYPVQDTCSSVCCTCWK